MNETIIRFIKEKNKRNVYSYAYKSSNGNDILHLEFFNTDDIPNEEIIKSGVLIYNNDNGLIQGDFSKFITIYKSKDNIFDLSVDEVYTESETTITKKEYTEEELLEINKSKRKAELNYKIVNLKNQISSTDYRIIKVYEYSLVGEDAGYDIEALHEERKNLRNEINAFEEELEALN